MGCCPQSRRSCAGSVWTPSTCWEARPPLLPRSSKTYATLASRRFDDLGRTDRFDTARLIAAEVGGEAVYVVEGAHADADRGWPDAVAVAGLAAGQQRPILLVLRDRVPPATTQALNDLRPSSVTIVGGEVAVSDEVEQELAAHGGRVSRLAGSTRYGTSAAIAEVAAADALPQSVWLATGRNWPDALSAGPAAAAQGGVLLLVDPVSLSASAPVRDWVVRHRDCSERVVLLGGPTTLSADVAVQVEGVHGSGGGT